jgi:hypothetical protein
VSIYSIAPLELGAVSTYPLASRKSKVSVENFAKAPAAKMSLEQFLDALPNFLGAADLRQFLSAVQRARENKRTILWGLGGHVIKVGLGPVLIDLMERGLISGIALNGAALIHDFEIAIAGNTSEDVDAGIGAGKFGMARETGEQINQIAKDAVNSRIGYGEAAGEFLSSAAAKARYASSSVVASAYRLKIPVTVHLAIGADIPHMHPSADGAALGAASYRDFRLFCGLVRSMQPGGVYLNWGSAVVLPEIFLKAVSVVRNLGVALRPITTANFDFIQHYRPLQNVVKRPTLADSKHGGVESKGYAFTGHHELLMPLVAAALVAGWPAAKKRTNERTRRKS